MSDWADEIARSLIFDRWAENLSDTEWCNRVSGALRSSLEAERRACVEIVMNVELGEDAVLQVLRAIRLRGQGRAQ